MNNRSSFVNNICHEIETLFSGLTFYGNQLTLPENWDRADSEIIKLLLSSGKLPKKALLVAIKIGQISAGKTCLEQMTNARYLYPKQVLYTAALAYCLEVSLFSAEDLSILKLSNAESRAEFIKEYGQENLAEKILEAVLNFTNKT